MIGRLIARGGYQRLHRHLCKCDQSLRSPLHARILTSLVYGCKNVAEVVCGERLNPTGDWLIMPRYFNDFSDVRQKAWCCHCGCSLKSAKTNRDHIPSKSLLVPPFPAELAVTEICESCNSSFSPDEEYLAAFLSAVLSGSTNPSDQKLDIGRRIFERNAALMANINACRRELKSEDARQIVWLPNISRVNNVVLKNARGHAYFENGEPMFSQPDIIECIPLLSLKGEARTEFYGVRGGVGIWPEVGSRWMQRLLSDDNFDEDGFLVVQPKVYRFRLDVDGGITIRSIIHEYLAATVRWF